MISKHLIGQIGAGIGFVSLMASFIIILYARITQDRSKGFFSRPDAKSTARENLGLWIALIGGGIAIALVVLSRNS